MSTRPLLLGHRGASKYARENTFAAFNLALEHGCDGFEFDVRYSNDGRGVICHDPRYRRRSVEACSFEELSLPCAEEAIRRYASHAYLDVELKVAGESGPILDALREAQGSRFVLSSFVPAIIEATHERHPKVPLGLICETPFQFKRWVKLPICAVMLHQRLAEREVIDDLHAAGRDVFVWTVNRERSMKKLAELGVDGIISDDTRLLVRTLRGKA